MIDFKKLPTDIREWILSDQIVDLIRGLESRIDVPGIHTGITAGIIYKLVTKTINPEAVVDVLKTAKLNEEQISTITKELRDKLLAPIKISLIGNLSVDIELINSSDNSSRPSTSPIPTVVNLKNQPPRPSSGMEIRPQSGNNAPFIIHRENPDLRPFIQTPPPGDAAKRSTPDAFPEAKTGESERIVHYSGPVTKIGEERKAP